MGRGITLRKLVLQSGRLLIPAGKTMVLNKTFSVIVRSGAVLEVEVF